MKTQTGYGQIRPAPKLPGEREFESMIRKAKKMVRKVKEKHYDLLMRHYGKKAREYKGKDAAQHEYYKQKYWHYFNRGVELMK